MLDALGCPRAHAGQIDAVPSPPPACLVPTDAPISAHRWHTHIWPGSDFCESFFEICSGPAKGRNSTKVAGGARASGYNSLRASKKIHFQAPKSPIPWKIARCRAPGSRTHTTRPGFCLKQLTEKSRPRQNGPTYSTQYKPFWSCNGVVLLA